jgi:hypothetical protein
MYSSRNRNRRHLNVVAAAAQPQRAVRSPYLIVTVMTVLLLCGVGAVPDSLAFVKGLLMVAAGIGVVIAFHQPLATWDQERIDDADRLN